MILDVSANLQLNVDYASMVQEIYLSNYGGIGLHRDKLLKQYLHGRCSWLWADERDFMSNLVCKLNNMRKKKRDAWLEIEDDRDIIHISYTRDELMVALDSSLTKKERNLRIHRMQRARRIRQATEAYAVCGAKKTL